MLTLIRCRGESRTALRVTSAPVPAYPLTLAQGRTLSHFHSFYDHGQALPSLARLETQPSLWLSPADAAARKIDDGVAIRAYNQRGSFAARAHVTEHIPPGAVWVRDEIGRAHV